MSETPRLEGARTFIGPHGQRRKISAAHLTDTQVADTVRMLMRDQLNHEAVCVMARDRIMCLAEEKAKLQAFKDYVHERLDAAGIPTHPGGEHSKEGCRVGDRLDIALSQPAPTLPAEPSEAVVDVTHKNLRTLNAGVSRETAEAIATYVLRAAYAADARPATVRGKALEWEPIITAPETNELVWIWGGDVVDTGLTWPASEDFDGPMGEPEIAYWDGYYWIIKDRDNGEQIRAVNPTHWRKFERPAPPALAASIGEVSTNDQ